MYDTPWRHTDSKQMDDSMTFENKPMKLNTNNGRLIEALEHFVDMLPDRVDESGNPAHLVEFSRQDNGGQRGFRIRVCAPGTNHDRSIQHERVFLGGSVKWGGGKWDEVVFDIHELLETLHEFQPGQNVEIFTNGDVRCGGVEGSLSFFRDSFPSIPVDTRTENKPVATYRFNSKSFLDNIESIAKGMAGEGVRLNLNDSGFSAELPDDNVNVAGEYARRHEVDSRVVESVTLDRKTINALVDCMTGSNAQNGRGDTGVRMWVDDLSVTCVSEPMRWHVSAVHLDRQGPDFASAAQLKRKPRIGAAHSGANHERGV